MSARDRYQRSVKELRVADVRSLQLARELQQWTARRVIVACRDAYTAGDRSPFVVDVVQLFAECRGGQ